MTLKLILLTVETDKDNDYLADALSAEVVFKLRPFVPGDIAKMLRLKATGVSVVELGDLLGGVDL